MNFINYYFTPFEWIERSGKKVEKKTIWRKKKSDENESYESNKSKKKTRKKVYKMKRKKHTKIAWWRKESNEENINFDAIRFNDPQMLFTFHIHSTVSTIPVRIESLTTDEHTAPPTPPPISRVRWLRLRWWYDHLDKTFKKKKKKNRRKIYRKIADKQKKRTVFVNNDFNSNWIATTHKSNF